MLKRILYYFPFTIGCLFYLMAGMMFSFGAINPFIWVLLALLLVAAILMSKKKWWGCLFGIAVGTYFGYMGTRDTGQVFSETPIGVAFCIYFIICGLVSYLGSRGKGLSREENEN